MSLPFHFNIATEGLRQDHRWIARLGFFQLEIIVEPVEPGGGGWFGDPRSKITVRVIYKDKKYEQSIMTPIPDATLISVFAKVSSIKRRIIEVIAKYKKKLFS